MVKSCVDKIRVKIEGDGLDCQGNNNPIVIKGTRIII